MHYRLAILGPKEAIVSFKAIGLTPFFCNDSNVALQYLYEIRKQTNDPLASEHFAIVFVTEDLARRIPPDDYKKLSSQPLPAIISIPSHKGSSGFGLERLNRIVERAVGSNILG